MGKENGRMVGGRYHCIMVRSIEYLYFSLVLSGHLLADRDSHVLAMIIYPNVRHDNVIHYDQHPGTYLLIRCHRATKAHAWGGRPREQAYPEHGWVISLALIET